MQQQPIVFQPHEYQKLVLGSDARITLAVSGIQAGKTMCGAAWLARQIARHEFKGTFLLAAPTYKILNASTLIKFCELLGGWKRIGRYKKADSEVELTGGEGKIFIRSCEEPDHLEGMTISGGAWLDEGGQMVERVWTNVLGRTSIHRAPILITTTPYFTNWVYRDVYLAYEKGDPEKYVVEWRSMDSPYFPKEEYEARKRTMNEAEFDRRYNGKFRQLAGLVFPEFSLAKHVVAPRQIPADWTFWCGVDFGFRPNPTVVLWIAKDTQGCYWVVQEYYETGKTATEHSEYILQREKTFRPKTYYCDPQGVEQINEFIRCGIKNVCGIKMLRKTGLEKITALLKTDKLKIFSTCRSLINELERYHFKEANNDGEQREEPVKADDHGIDALRYMVANTSFDEARIYQKIHTDTGWSYREWKENMKRKEEVMDRFVAQRKRIDDNAIK